MEYDFKVFYRKGAKNTIAYAVLRHLNWGYTNVDPYLDILRLLVFDRNNTQVLSKVDKVDSTAWERQNCDPDYDSHCTHTVLAADVRPLRNCLH